MAFFKSMSSSTVQELKSGGGPFSATTPPVTISADTSAATLAAVAVVPPTSTASTIITKDIRLLQQQRMHKFVLRDKSEVKAIYNLQDKLNLKKERTVHNDTKLLKCISSWIGVNTPFQYNVHQGLSQIPYMKFELNGCT